MSFLLPALMLAGLAVALFSGLPVAVACTSGTAQTI